VSTRTRLVIAGAAVVAVLAFLALQIARSDPTAWQDLPLCADAHTSPCLEGGRVVVPDGGGGFTTIDGPAWEQGAR
jgi:hypothetical protein